MAAGKALSRAQVDEIIERSKRKESAQSIAVAMGISIGPVYSHVAKWRKRNGMKPLADEHALSRETRRTIVDMHRTGALNREIAAELELSVSSVEKTLHDYRQATGERSRKDVQDQAARDRIDAIGQIYTSHNGEISAADILKIAIETIPHPTGWTKQLVYSAMDQWRRRMGIVAPCVARQELWEYIHQQLRTGYTAESVAAHLNDHRLGLVHGIPWTPNAVRVFHSDYAGRNGELISHMRTDEQVLEVSFRCALLRAESEHWTIVDMVDLFNETEYAFPPNGRPWTAKALYAAIHRATKIVQDLEETRAVHKIVATADTNFALQIADANLTTEPTVPPSEIESESDSQHEPSNHDETGSADTESTGTDTKLDDHPVSSITESEKAERLRAIAMRILDLRDEGAQGREIRLILDVEFPIDDRWQLSHIAAVEQYGRRAGMVLPTIDLSEIAPAIDKLNATMTMDEIVEHLNASQIENAVRPGQPWQKRHVRRVLQFATNMRKKQHRQQPTADDDDPIPIQHECDGPTRTEKLLGRRQLRRSDQLIREEARKKLAMRDAAFARAQELHRQMQQLREELASHEFMLNEIAEAETLLIATGPPILQDRLAKLQAMPRNESADLSENAQEIEKITQRIMREDWR